LVVVDQLEELFTADVSPDEQRGFVAELEDLATRGPVLVGLRADFYGRALAYPPLARGLQESQVVVTAMTEPELRRAITEPARRAHVDIEEGLVDLLLADAAPLVARSPAAHEPGALPLLSHALLATWEQGHGRRLTLADYRATGGLRSAVAQTAEQVYAELTGTEQELARHLFLRLVRVSANGPETHCRVDRNDLVGDGAYAAELGGVLERFITSRLVAVDSDAIQITHEALLGAWPRLRDWIDADRAGLLTGQRLLEAAQTWDQEHRDPTALYAGSRLAAARDWAEAAGALPPVIHEFLTASTGSERRTVRRLRRTIAALVVLLLLAAGGGTVAVQQRSRALAEEAAATADRNRAISRLVAGRAERIRDKDVSLAAQLALVAYGIWPTVEARSVLLDSSAIHTATRLLGSTGVMQSVAISPEQGLLAAGTADQNVLLWDLTAPHHPVRLDALTGPTDTVFAVAFSPDGRTLVAGSGDHRIYRWDLTNPQRPVPLGEPLTGPGELVYSVAFSPDGRTLVAGSGDHLVHRWDLADPFHPAPLAPLAGADSYVQSVVFSRSGDLLAAGSDDAAVRLWDVRNPSAPALLGDPLTGPGSTVFTVAISPDSGTLAAGSRDGHIYLWDITDPRRPQPFDTPLEGASGWVQTAVFSPDGGTLAAGSSGQAWLWDWRAGRIITVLPHPGPVTSLTYGDDAHTLISGAADGTARMWYLPGPSLPGDDVTINNIRFSPDGNRLAAASGEIRLWDVTERRPLGPPITNPTGYSSAVAFTPDTNTLIVSDRDGGLRTWDVTDPGQPAPLSARVGAHALLIEQIALSPDGTTLATAGDDNLVRLWDLTNPADPQLLTELAGFSAYVYSVQFNPDGTILAAAAVDNTVRIWDVSQPRHVTMLGEPLVSSDHYALSVAFHPHKPVLAVGSADSNIYLWNISDQNRPRRLAQPLVGPDNYVYALAFAPDGGTLAAANTDETLWLWNLTDPTEPTVWATLTAAEGSLYTAVFSPNGDTIAAGGAANIVWLWETNPERVAEHICRTAGDPLTPGEWDKYVPDLPYLSSC
jgi:WD40 repeat protein